MIAGVEQMGYEVVAGEGYFKIYAGEKTRCCICVIYEGGCLREHIGFGEPGHFIVLGRHIRLEVWGVPEEWISRYEYPLLKRIDDCPGTAGKAYARKVVYVLDDLEDDPDGDISLSVIRTFNCLSHLVLYCVVPRTMIPQLKQAANDHIVFLPDKGSYDSLLAEQVVVIGSGRVAVEGLLAGLPVVVIGKYGFGGLMTADNLVAFCSNQFSGRPGGMLGERIPPMLLAQEIGYILDVMNTGELDDLLAISRDDIKRLKAFCQEDCVKAIVETIREVCAKCGDMNDAGVLTLKPRLSSSIAIERKAPTPEEVFWLRNIHTNKVLSAFGDFEMGLLAQCNGSSTVEEVIAALGDEYDAADCVAFMRSLWELRVLSFKK